MTIAITDLSQGCQANNTHNCILEGDRFEEVVDRSAFFSGVAAGNRGDMNIASASQESLYFSAIKPLCELYSAKNIPVLPIGLKLFYRQRLLLAALVIATDGEADIYNVLFRALNQFSSQLHVPWLVGLSSKKRHLLE